MWKVRVGLIAAKWHLQSFVLMKLGGKPKKESQTKHIPGTWSRYLKCKTILIFKYPSIPVSNYKKSNKKNSFIEYFPNSNNRLEVSSFVRANLCFPGHGDSLGLQWGWCSEGGFCQVTDSKLSRKERFEMWKAAGSSWFKSCTNISNPIACNFECRDEHGFRNRQAQICLPFLKPSFTPLKFAHSSAVLNICPSFIFFPRSHC